MLDLFREVIEKKRTLIFEYEGINQPMAFQYCMSLQ